jgi:hypothetical protein
MLFGVIYFAIVGGDPGRTNVVIAGVFSVAWLVIGFLFLFGRKFVTGVSILHPEDYKTKVPVVSEAPVASESSVGPETPSLGGISLAGE